MNHRSGRRAVIAYGVARYVDGIGFIARQEGVKAPTAARRAVFVGDETLLALYEPKPTTDLDETLPH
jgi:hypothetical protein